MNANKKYLQDYAKSWAMYQVARPGHEEAISPSKPIHELVQMERELKRQNSKKAQEMLIQQDFGYIGEAANKRYNQDAASRRLQTDLNRNINEHLADHMQPNVSV